jgi:hypothetical protein
VLAMAVSLALVLAPVGPLAAATGGHGAAPPPVLTPPTRGMARLTAASPFAPVGGTVRWTATGLPPSQRLHLVWETAHGAWKVNGPALIGDTYTFGKETLASVESTAAGTASGQFQVPVGFGGPHPFGLATASGQVLAVSDVIVTVSAAIDRQSAPDGAFFTIHVTGLGYGGGFDAYMAEYGVLYDNHYMGFISAVDTQGSATFRVRAEGVGGHVISLIDSPVEGPYLNLQQSPYPWFSQFSWPVQVTPATPQTLSTTVDPLPTFVGHNLTLQPGSGTVGSRLVLTGSGLPANAALTVRWWTEAGNRVTASGYAATSFVLATVHTNASGAFTLVTKVPVDLGGPPHTVDLLDGSRVVGTAQFRILPALVGLSSAVVREGQPFVVHLTGVGWTQYDNIYAVDYDNAYVGYGCGFNSHGDVQLVLRAAGAPGYHFIDIYPSPYQGATNFPNWYGMPQLTYAQDHPGDTLPAFHAVIRVVP